MPFRIGIGFDVHPFSEKRKLILGGVEIPFPKGLAGHSDADVLVHALCDALLGAAALGDIGIHFPDTDEKYKNISSLELLRLVNKMILRKGYQIGNIDGVIIAQQPQLAAYLPAMCQVLAETLQADPDRISVKATTTEHLGFTGRKEGIASVVSVLLETIPDFSS